ncbi:MAG: SDR family oxidoreductase, partial [Anaeroplasmataceae bacterium]
GAGGVLCAEMAKSIAALGAKVAILDLTYDNGVKVEKEITSAGFVAKTYKCNVLEKDSIKAAHEAILKDLGKCDILINGAGGNNPKANTDEEFFSNEKKEGVKTFFDLDESGIKFVFDLNFMGTLLPTQEFIQDMIGREGCSVINISSMNSFTPLTKIPAYSAAKSAISNFTQWLSVHFAKQNIRVNAIAPGFFVTKQNEKLLFNEDGSRTARTDKILRNTPMDRFGSAEELIGSIIFLCSPSASGFVNGVVLPIDGGFSAYSGV